MFYKFYVEIFLYKILFLKVYIYSQILKIPFVTYDFFPNPINSTNFVKHLYFSHIITNISIGSNNQSFFTPFKMQSYTTYIFESELYNNDKQSFEKLSPLFYKNKSNTYINDSKLEYFYFEQFSEAYYSRDNFKIGFKKNFLILNKVKFFCATGIYDQKIDEVDTASVIGLKLSDDLDIGKNMTFIYQLKERNLINFPTFTYKFSKKNFLDDKGDLIFGINFFDHNNFVLTKAEEILGFNKIDWGYNFKDVKYGNISLNYSNTAILLLEYELIFGTSNFNDLIKKNFFNYHQQECKKESFTYLFNNYYYYICDKSINLKDFKNITFHLENYYFELTKDDLFYEYNNKKIFLIIGSNVHTSYWSFGRLFLKKYQIYFDFDRKLLGIFKGKKVGKKKDINKNYIIIVILFFIIIFLILYIFFYLRKYKILFNKKIIENEMKEEYYYNFNKKDEKTKNLLIN